MSTQVKATITEKGNGLPSIGSLCYHQDTDTVYEVVAWDKSDRISTHGDGRGNSVNVILEEKGTASDYSADEWADIESNNYGVEIADDEAKWDAEIERDVASGAMDRAFNRLSEEE